MLKVHTKHLGAVVIVCLQGRLVNRETAALSNAVDSVSGAGALILDLAGVSLIDAGGLGVLLELRERTEAKGVPFKLMHVTKLVRQVLEITCLDSVFEITSGVELLPAVSCGKTASVMQFAPCA